MTVGLDFVRSALAASVHRPATLRGDERFAAVAVVLSERNGEAEVLLIRRAEHPGDPWSGHMAFPGGRKEDADVDLLETAMREASEEVGLDLRRELLVGRLDDLPAIARGKPVGLVIAVFVFALDREPTLVADAREVKEILWTKLSTLASGQNDSTFSYDLAGRQLSLPAYDVEGRIVWGLTHRMLGTLLECLASARAALERGEP